MRIGIDANPIVRNRGGIGWHTYHVLRALVELKDPDLDLIAYVSPGSADASVMHEPWARSRRLTWRETGGWALRWRGTRDKLDVFHGPNFKLPTVGRFGGIVTIHDLWLARHPQFSRKLFGQWGATRRVRRTAHEAARIITVSDHSARDIVAICGVPREKVTVIHNAVSEEFYPSHDPLALAAWGRRFGWTPRPFILFVGGADPRKNHRAVLEAYVGRQEQLKSHTIIMVGSPTHRFGNLCDSVAAAGLEKHVVCTGPLSLTDLRMLYSHAEVFVFPSIYEGFGMPVLEAMACGAPVITSNTTALPEVAGDAAVLVDPDKPDELADAMARVIHDSSLRASLREKGFQRVKRFTWEQTARQTLAVYKEVCGG